MPAKFFPLPALGALRVTGEDARSFLQNQLSSDLDEVSVARGQLSAWHDPKGRVLAFLRVLPSPQGFLLVMHAGLLETVAKRMRMFVLRSKVVLEPGPPVHGLAPEQAAEWLAAAGLESEDTPLAAACNDELSAMRMPGEAGWLVVGEARLPDSEGAKEAEASVEPAARAETAWERAEIEAGLPEVYPATSGQFVAQMLNLDQLGAVSFTKGCYPGQEIVARAHHLGRVKRRMQPFRVAGPAPEPGSTLAESGGTVVRAAAGAPDTLVLAVVATG